MHRAEEGRLYRRVRPRVVGEETMSVRGEKPLQAGRHLWAPSHQYGPSQTQVVPNKPNLEWLVRTIFKFLITQDLGNY